MHTLFTLPPYIHAINNCHVTSLTNRAHLFASHALGSGLQALVHGLRTACVGSLLVDMCHTAVYASMHGWCVHPVWTQFFPRTKAGGTRTKRTNTSADCSTGRRRQRRRWPMATISCVMILVQTETVRAAAFLCGCSLDASGGNFSSLVYVAHETSTLNGSLHLQARAHKRTIIQKHLPLPLSFAHTHIIRIIRSVCLFSEKQQHKICLFATSFATSAELQVRFVWLFCFASTAGPPKLLLVRRFNESCRDAYRRHFRSSCRKRNDERRCPIQTRRRILHAYLRLS